jgi:hypothetical protein
MKVELFGFGCFSLDLETRRDFEREAAGFVKKSIPRQRNEVNFCQLDIILQHFATT